MHKMSIFIIFLARPTSTARHGMASDVIALQANPLRGGEKREVIKNQQKNTFRKGFFPIFLKCESRRVTDPVFCLDPVSVP